jgi:acetate kinase
MTDEKPHRFSGWPLILTINGGSSSIQFALFMAGDSLQRFLEGGIERIGRPDAALRVTGVNRADHFSRSVKAPDHPVASDSDLRRTGIRRDRARRGAERSE